MRGNGAGETATEILPADDGQAFDLSRSPTALEAITRAEIDVQIATAKRFPRSPERFLREACAMVALSPALAEKCTYNLPARRNEDGSMGKPISGPSVRLAEIVACCWKNLRVVGRIVGDDGRFVTAQGVCLDLEANVGYSMESKRGVTTRKGRRFGDEMIKTTSNAAIAVATRNATFKAVPGAFVDIVHEESKRVARGDVKTLPDRARRALDYFTGRGVAEADIFRVLGVVGPADITLDHLMLLNGFRTSLAEGHGTLEEIFAPPAEAGAAVEPRRPGETRSAALSRRLEGRESEAEEPAFAPGTPGRIGTEAEDEAEAAGVGEDQESTEAGERG